MAACLARFVFPLLLAASSGCAGAVPLTVTTWGEEYIEEQIPADVFADGWSVAFTKFLVVFAAIDVADAAGVEAGSFQTPTVMDLHAPGPAEITRFEAVPTQRFEQVSIVVEPRSDAVAGSASEADATLMIDNGYSVFVEGSATKAASTIDFAWGFATATSYHDCETVDEGLGQVVRAGEENSMEATVHGDHFFYDDLASPEASVRFDAIAAADANTDGTVTHAELDAVDLTTLPANQYGSAGAAETLLDFVAALSRTLVHLNGEGECSITAR